MRAIGRQIEHKRHMKSSMLPNPRRNQIREQHDKQEIICLNAGLRQQQHLLGNFDVTACHIEMKQRDEYPCTQKDIEKNVLPSAGAIVELINADIEHDER